MVPEQGVNFCTGTRILEQGPRAAEQGGSGGRTDRRSRGSPTLRAMQLTATVARLGPCSSSGSTRSTRWLAPSAAAQMQVVAFIEPRAPERSDGRADVIERILRHCGLWQPSTPRAPPAKDASVHGPDDASEEPRELTYVDIDTFMATF